MPPLEGINQRDEGLGEGRQEGIRGRKEHHWLLQDELGDNLDHREREGKKKEGKVRGEYGKEIGRRQGSYSDDIAKPEVLKDREQRDLQEGDPGLNKGTKRDGDLRPLQGEGGPNPPIGRNNDIIHNPPNESLCLPRGLGLLLLEDQHELVEAVAGDGESREGREEHKAGR